MFEMTKLVRGSALNKSPVFAGVSPRDTLGG
jgi:hypothetical protein